VRKRSSAPLALSCRERPVLRKRQGVLQLKLAGGETAGSRPGTLLRTCGVCQATEDDPAVVNDKDLGSDFEDEDPMPTDELD